MKEKPKHSIINFIEQILIILAKGFVAWLPIGLFLEIIGIDLLVGTTVYTHFYEYLGAIFAVGLPLHYFIWKT
jgi:hypothetical protein